MPRWRPGLLRPGRLRRPRRPFADAVAALRAAQSAADRLRGTADLNAHANGLGLTGVINAGNLEDQEYPLQLWRERVGLLDALVDVHATGARFVRY